MQRYFIELSYNGTAYHGWQIQPNAITVQQRLDKALSVYFRQTVATLGCGRTDTGVHATQFYAHFDLDSASACPEIDVTGVNALLPYDIAVSRIFEVANDAHARFDATSRTYHYHIHFQKDPFKIDRSWLYKGRLDVDRMNQVAAVLPEYTDFSCFSKSNTQTFTNNCRLTKAVFTEHSGGLQFTIQADRFLRNMVRAVVGTLIRVGKGEIDLQGVRTILESKNRSAAGQSVPACGLYLTEVQYPYIDNAHINNAHG
ncbi:tRNA pseudouridine(38-40) synthase TruA [Pedobacter faecalis]|uniref:tRNA pseudouridine(38-40) synthase TruA n=1 Tax=Pedobacter faecalis TaxID=3041495 RepID=UPI00254B6D74|nr:tRNA pseudouridine(38-40) synthase TruA [Pedobacter sp. ELA7]